MAFSPGDVIRFTVEQTYDTQTCLNVFYYKCNDPFESGATPAQMGEFFWGWVEAEWIDLVSNNVTFNRVIVENLDGDLDFGEYTIPDGENTGSGAGESLGAFTAFGIQLNRTNRLVRQGSKRIVGVQEAAAGNYGVLTPTALASAQALADAFALDIVVGLVTLANPVIVGFPNGTRPARVEVPIDTCTAKTVLTTQNTRKRNS